MRGGDERRLEGLTKDELRQRVGRNKEQEMRELVRKGVLA